MFDKHLPFGAFYSLTLGLNSLVKTKIESAKDGPIPNAKKRVPMPATPPKRAPRTTTVTSMLPLTIAMGYPVIRCRPVIKPSLGPGPRLAMRYMAPPKPVMKTPEAAIRMFNENVSKFGRYGRLKSSTIEIIMMLKIVPRPGTCFKNTHKNRTIELITAVDTPIDQPVCIEKPCANTVHGLTPTPAAISNASPKPKMINPRIRNANDTIGGLIVSILGELQNKRGIALILKMSNFMAI